MSHLKLRLISILLNTMIVNHSSHTPLTKRMKADTIFPIIVSSYLGSYFESFYYTFMLVSTFEHMTPDNE